MAVQREVLKPECWVEQRVLQKVEHLVVPRVVPMVDQKVAY
jgi:hypothetical protein